MGIVARVVVLQPYVPAYRAPFFTALEARLRSQGHELVVAAGEPTGPQAKRNDAAHLDGVQQRTLRVRTLKVGSARLRLVNARSVWRDADVIVAELAAGSAATYGALLQCRRPVGVWGHVEAFTAPDTRVTRTLRRWQTRAAAHVLAYTDAGAAAAKDWGVASGHVTALHNTIDVGALTQAIAGIREQSQAEVRARLGVGTGPIFAMIGGLDASKRVDLVVETLDLLWSSRPEIQLVVGGRGDLEAAFNPAVSRGQVQLLGYVENETKADLAHVATALLNPGRVGLVAVESMAMQLPLITTRGAGHGPEYGYLTPGVDSVECAPSASALAAAMTELADDPVGAGSMASAIGRKAEAFSLDHMVDKYAAALMSLIDDAKTRRCHPKM